MEKVIIVGGFIEIIELCEENNIIIKGIFDKCSEYEMYSYKVLGNDSDAKKLLTTFNKYPLIITPDSPLIRRKLKLYYQELGYHFTSLISMHANISKSAFITNGSIIQSNVNISSKVNIGEFVKVNSMSNIMHNSTIGDFTTIAPNAVVLGNVSIGRECYIGANATILPNVHIADNVVIGAGAVVTKNIEECGTVYVGIPAKKLDKPE